MNQRITQYWINRTRFVAGLFFYKAISYETLEKENRRIWEGIKRNPEVRKAVLAALHARLSSSECS